MTLKGAKRTKYIREYMRKRRAAERAAKAAGKTDFEQVHPAEPLDWRKGKTPEQIAHLEDLGQKVREALRQAEEGLDLEREGCSKFVRPRPNCSRSRSNYSPRTKS